MEYTIKFRPIRLEDARFINDLRQQDDMEKMICGVSRPVSPERDAKWVEELILNDNATIVYYAITNLDGDQIIGYTSISEIDFRNGTCYWGGIKVDQAHARVGIGTQVAVKLLKYVFEELRMSRCAAECQEHHMAALNLMLKVGYQKEGLMRKRLFKNGVHNNLWLLSVTDTEYIEIKKKFDL